MRTTLTLDPDVVVLLKEAAYRQGKSFEQVVNDAIRRGLSPQGRPEPRQDLRVRPHRTTLRRGVDAVHLNRLGDELEDEVILDGIASRE